MSGQEKGGLAPPFLLSHFRIGRSENDIGETRDMTGISSPLDWDKREARLRESFARQSLMKTFGAEISQAAPGEIHIEFGRADHLLQQAGFLHAGVATAIVDSACGYAAISLQPLDRDVLTIEFKTNFLRPAAGGRFMAHGKVIKPGKQVLVCEGEVWEVAPQRRMIAKMLATMMVVPAGQE
jgi:uncharacterized protein (TIGR00369 family)